MAGNDKSGVIATAIIIVVGTTFAVFSIWDLGVQHALNIRQTESTVRQYEIDAEKVIQETCVGLEADQMSKCIANTIRSTEVAQTTIKNLQAQNEIALWAKWAVFVSFITTFVSAFGVWLVRENLVETRKAVEATITATDIQQRVGEAQVRAYLTCVAGRFVFENESLTVYAKFRNTGLSPTGKVTVVGDLHAVASVTEIGGSAKNLISEQIASIDGDEGPSIAAQSEQECMMMWVSDQFPPGLYPALSLDNGAMRVFGKAQWKDVFDKEHSIDFALMKDPNIATLRLPMGDWRSRWEQKMIAFNHGARPADRKES